MASDTFPGSCDRQRRFTMNSPYRFNLRHAAFAAVLLALAFVVAGAAQAQTGAALHDAPVVTYTLLFSFNLNDGNGLSPQAGLVQDANGSLYGTTSGDGIHGDGSVFKITPSGMLTTIYDFCSQTNCADGAFPKAGLTLATNGSLYGTTSGGGAIGDGTVFKITPSGALTTLHSFAGYPTDGSLPLAGMVQGTDGDFYGTTSAGGTSDVGTIFSITPSGTLTTLHSFDGTDGANPVAGLIQATNGNLYGTTRSSGANGYGTVFEITPSGTLTTLYSFCSQYSGGVCTDGSAPYAGLIQGANGNFYGTTSTGGATCTGGCGTVFEITSSGTLTILHNFDLTDGLYPAAPLVQGSDGNSYGTTEFGGTDSNCEYGCGTAFKITPSGTLTSLYSFCPVSSCTDAPFPTTPLVQHTNGSFFGTSMDGGASNLGTVFKLSVGLGPFVNLVSTSGKEGAEIGILGQGFSSSSVVEFDGVTATMITLSGTTFITATVPAGALSGLVTVTTGATTLTSNQKFRVTPVITSFTPPSGPAGTPVMITGSGLTQTTKVTFGGVAATTVTVNSDTQVTADVPTGAVTGRIVITTPGGTATSASSFTVN
jgi:uncharacterized repeat protein (TIGR03803 family)